MRNETFIEFSSLFNNEEGRMGVVVTFLAVLELLKDSLIEIVQSEEFGPIHIRGIEEVH
jgi:segregation and condensation protein A